MKNISFFRIKIAQVQSQDLAEKIQNGLMEILDEKDQEFLVSEDFGDYEVLYTFLSDYKVEKIADLFQSLGVLLEKKDITEDVLMAREKGEEFIFTFEDQEYRTILEKFLEHNLTVDMILDKINESGIDSLTDLDKKILAK